MELPKEEYTYTEENGHRITHCTMRQKALHTIGLNSGHVGRRLYKRNGKQYYKPFRNYFCGRDDDLDQLVDAGYMECIENERNGEKDRTYWFNRKGLDWLGEQMNTIICDEED